MDFTWAMKKKPSGVYRARLALQGFQQKEGLQYQHDDKSAPVINAMSIKIILVLVVLGNWFTKIIDVQGAFLHGQFQRRKEKLYTEVPEGFEKYYPHNAILLMLRTIYGSIQGAIQWWRECCKAMYYLKWKRHDVDPCLFVKWEETNGLSKLIVFLLWVDDCLICGPQQFVQKEANEFSRLFDVTDETPDGNMTEYIGNKIERNDERIRLT